MPLAVQVPVVLALLCAVRARRDHRPRVSRGDEFDQLIRVVTFIGDYGLCREVFNQWGALGDIRLLSGG